MVRGMVRAIIVAGLIVGFVASRIITLRGHDPRLGIGVSAVAAFIGGWLYSWISGSEVRLMSTWSWIYAAIAAVLAMFIWHIVRHRGTYERPTFRRAY